MNTIRRNSEYLADLIEGLLNISKIEAGRLELHRNSISLFELLDQLEQMFAPQAEAKGLDFTVIRCSNLPKYVVADEKRLRQILINLVGNAVKYTSVGSVVVEIRYRNQVADISVRDTGVGIAPENIQRIMMPFERVRTSNMPDVHGTGLGLTIVRLLTEIMGGELTVESEIGKGSEFRVNLLLFETGVPHVKKSIVEGATSYQGEQKTILVVDDEAIHRGLISDLLQPLGFRVLEAPDAATARTMLGSYIDLFILDISMPEENGLSLAVFIREQYPSTSIIMLSADAEEQHLKKQNEPKVYNGYVVKPMNNQTLLLEVTQQLSLIWSYESTSEERVFDDTLFVTGSNELRVEKPALSKAPSELIPLLKELKAHLDIGHSKGARNSLEAFKQHEWPSKEILSAWQALADAYQYTELAEQINNRISDEH